MRKLRKLKKYLAYNLGGKKMRNRTFYGVEVSDYAENNNKVDYSTLAKTGDAILCNNIPNIDYNIYDNIINGDLWDNEEQNEFEIFQYYIVSDSLKEILCYHTDEIVMYSELLDCYIWGVTHWGTSWDYVLTDITL